MGDTETGLPCSGTIPPMPHSSDRPSVLLTTEGTYPFEGGGVTTWCDVILNGLPDIDVHLIAVTGSTAITL
ncbi:MAG: DUF3492 domain-containing protein, partial [Bacteroidota bacterium]